MRTTINSLIVNIVYNIDVTDSFIIADYKVDRKSSDESSNDDMGRSKIPS